MKAAGKSAAPRSRRKASAKGTDKTNAREWVGRDVSEDFHPRRFSIRFSLRLVLIAVIAALALVVLRSDVLRMRYALSEATALERQLLAEQRLDTVTMRQLRAPGPLVEVARREGFVQPERIIDLGSMGAADARGAKR